MVANTPTSWCARAPFETLDECLAFVKKRYAEEMIRCTAIDIETGQRFTQRTPAHVFRGEVEWVDECLSRRERVRRGHFRGVGETDLSAIGQANLETAQGATSRADARRRPRYGAMVGEGGQRLAELLCRTDQRPDPLRYALARTYGSVRGDRGNPAPYRNQEDGRDTAGDAGCTEDRAAFGWRRGSDRATAAVPSPRR